MYSGSGYHAAVLSEIAVKFNLSSRTTLFREMVKGWSAEFSRRSLSFMTNSGIEIDDKRVALAGPDNLAPRYDVVPHPPSAPFSQRPLRLREAAKTDSKVKKTILFPGINSLGKGYFLGLELAKVLAQRGHRVFLRDCGIDLQGTNLEVFPSQMDEEDFFARLTESDLVVLPYLPKWFADRTSGLAADALMCRTPVAAVEGTWLAGFVNRNGSGLLLPFDIDEAAEVTIDFISSGALEYCTSGLSGSAGRYLEQNSWPQFLNFFSQKH